MLGPMTIGALSSGAGGESRTYAQILVEDFGADEVWPLVDIASGTTIHAYVNGNRNGTLAGWDLQDAAGPVEGSLAPFSDGTTSDKGDIYTSNGTDGLDDIFNGSVGSALIHLKVAGAGVWSDNAIRTGVILYSDVNNFIAMDKDSNNALRWRYNAGGALKTITHTTSETGWFSMGISWDANADEMKAYFGAVGSELTQVGATQTELGTWAGALATTRTAIGVVNTQNVQNIWHGWLAYAAVRFGATW